MLTRNRVINETEFHCFNHPEEKRRYLMKKLLFTSATALATTIALCLASTLEVTAQEQQLLSDDKPAEYKTLPTIDPNRALIVDPNRGQLITNPQFKAKGSDGTAYECCTNWNSSTGTTGCASFADPCDDDMFEAY